MLDRLSTGPSQRQAAEMQYSSDHARVAQQFAAADMRTSGTIALAGRPRAATHCPSRMLGVVPRERECPLGQAEIKASFLGAGDGPLLFGRVPHDVIILPLFLKVTALNRAGTLFDLPLF